MQTKDQLIQQIRERSPWYQRIEFPKFGITTTDDVNNILADNAWDNKIGNLTIAEATRLRPIPKWDAIKIFLPDFKEKSVLEIGSNCGFFSFKFSDLGAKQVLGIDIATHWLSNANWCKEVLNKQNVSFLNVDFMAFNGSTFGNKAGLLRDEIDQISIPNNRFDIVFMSTVLDHMFFHSLPFTR